MGYDLRDDRDIGGRIGAPGRGAAAGAVPGRRTLTDSLPMGPPRMPRRTPAPGPTVEEGDDEQVADPVTRMVAQAASASPGGLPDALRGRLEGALGTGLSDVRIHTSSDAADAAGSLDAHAFAVGQDVFFAAGQYDPTSPEGQSLIAHEVAHTVQQRGASHDVQTKLAVSAPGDHHEAEADRFAESFAAGGSAPVSSVAVGSVSRKAIARQVDIVRGGGNPSVTTVPAAQPAPPDRLTALEGRVTENERRTEVNELYDGFLLDLSVEFTELLSRVDGAYAPYKQAYDLHVGALQRRAAQIALMRDLLLNILFVGLGGAVGGTIQQVLRGASQSLLANAVATAVGDTSKYGTRQVGGEGRRIPPPIDPAGDAPDLWIHAVRSDVLAVQGALLRELRSARTSAVQSGVDANRIAAMRTELATINGLCRPRPRTDYSLDMWRGWMEQRLGAMNSREGLTGFMMSYDGVLHDAYEQVGPTGRATLLAMTCTAATEGPANRSAGRVVDYSYSTCNLPPGGTPPAGTGQ